MLDEDKDNEKDNDLSLIKRRLYARKEPADVKRRQEELHRLGVTRRSIGTQEAGSTLAQAKYKNLALLRARRWGRMLRFSGLLALVLVVVIVAVVVTFWYRSTQTVTAAQIALAIEAPQEFTAGSEITYLVRYANNSRVDWINVELVLKPPRGFTFSGSDTEVDQAGRQLIINTDDVVSGDSGEIRIRGRLIGEQNETAVSELEIFLTPVNFPSGRLSKSAVLATTITALPLDISLNISSDAASGERVLATISVGNLSPSTLVGGYLRLKLAPGIQLATADEDFSAGFSVLGSEWVLPDLAPLAEAERTLVFHVEGQPGEKRVIDIEAGIRQDGQDFVQRELSHVLTISATEVVVEQFYNNDSTPLTVQAGQTITGEVHYRNIGAVGLKDAIVNVAFEGISFDAQTLGLSGVGSYNPATRSISWSAATVPELAVIQPQQEGKLRYSFRILATDQFPSAGDNVKNHVLVTTATVDSPDLPAPVGQPRQVISDRAVLSVGTDLILEATALYDDGRLGLTSVGPLPPQVGQTTSYTLRFRIGTTLNDVSDLSLTAVLPDGVRYTKNNYMTAGELQFNERTGELVWTLLLMDALTGRASPHQELHVQVEIAPGEDIRGQAVSLLNKVELHGVDQFTDEAVSSVLKGFPTTGTAVPGSGKVQ